MKNEILNIAKEIKELNLLQQAEIKKIKRKSQLSNLELSQKINNAKTQASLKMKESDFNVGGAGGDLRFTTSLLKNKDFQIEALSKDFKAEENSINVKVTFVKNDELATIIKKEFYRVNLNTNEIELLTISL